MWAYWLGAIPVTVEEILKACPRQRVTALSRGALSYRTAGQGPAVVFLHGLAGNSLSWARQFPALAARYRIVAWDAPGFGLSDAVEPDVEVFADVLRELLDHLGCGPAAVAGHSMGGVVAARLAAGHPDKVARLVLSCSHAGYGESADSPMQPRVEQRVRELASVGAAEYGLIRARGLFPAGFADKEAMGVAAGVAAEARPEGIRSSTRMLQLADNRSVLPRLEMPVLVITGERDPVVKPHLRDELRALTPQARHIEMPGAGHAPYLEYPAAYNAILDEFLSPG
ncbi:alpha/beta fold hydrolase [Shumkonia mesophila]|uniref:alpha/beta fold hydrolase n=1 Tax=Shumkonia mesophila TaxID=2838854 RepID=UPI002934B95A|nr:alpha/beta fold hydrolase [Shumkonia mesophila]